MMSGVMSGALELLSLKCTTRAISDFWRWRSNVVLPPASSPLLRPAADPTGSATLLDTVAGVRVLWPHTH